MKQTTPCTRVAQQRVRQRRRADQLQRAVHPAGHERTDLRGQLPVVDEHMVDADRRAARRAFAGSRVVASTVIPRCLASTAAAIPTDEVPPRISTVSPGCASSPTVSEPYAVCSVSGIAPIVAQSSVGW